MNDIGTKIKILRKRRDLSQAEMAHHLGISRATVSNYETNRRAPSIHELRRISEWLGVSLDYFGVEADDEVFEFLTRANSVFTSKELSKEDKEKAYKEVMKMYLEVE